MNKVLTTPPPDLKKLRVEVPTSLVRIIGRMLTRDKTRRYQTMRQVAVDLESGQQPTTPKSAETIRKVAPLSRIGFSRYGLLLVGGILLAGIFGAIRLLPLGTRASPTNTPESTIFPPPSTSVSSATDILPTATKESFGVLTGGVCTGQQLFCVGLVTDVGKIDDQSFNQSAWEGVQQAERELGALVQNIETTDAKDYAKNIATFADAGFDVIITVGFNLSTATRTAARAYPNIKFIGVDQDQFEGTIENLAGLVFPEDKAGFLVGALAAMMSKSNKIGAVCGTDAVPAVWRYGEGYKAGAAYADAQKGTTTEVFVVYHSDVGFDKTFTDPNWGATTARFEIFRGADVIFGCGGVTGNGAITAAAQADVYAIGVDTDQYLTLPEVAPHMLSSALKLESSGVFELIKLAKEGNFPTGNYLGDAGYAPFHDLDGEVPADVKAKMEAINAGLLDGSIKTNVLPSKP